jgi:hypothetical protein
LQALNGFQNLAHIGLRNLAEWEARQKAGPDIGQYDSLVLQSRYAKVMARARR